MFRRLPLFGRQAYPAPAHPVIAPTAHSDDRPVPDAGREARTVPPAPAASARAVELAASMAQRGAPIPVLMAQFPHVVDRIASAWSNPPRLAEVFRELLVDDRGGRQGFREDAAAELFALHRASLGETAKPALARTAGW